MLNNGDVQRRKQYMVLVIQFWNWDNKQSMIFPRVTINNR